MSMLSDSIYSGDSGGRGGSSGGGSSTSSIAYYRFPTGAFTIPSHATTAEGRVITVNGDIQEHDPSDEIDHSGSSILLGIGAWEVQYSFGTKIPGPDRGAGRRQQVDVWVLDEDNDKTLGKNYRQYIRGDDVDLGIHGTITFYLETPTHINLRMVSAEPQNTDYKTVPVQTGFVTIIKHGGARGVRGIQGIQGKDGSPADVFAKYFLTAQDVSADDSRSIDGATIKAYTLDRQIGADGQVALVDGAGVKAGYQGFGLNKGVWRFDINVRLAAIAADNREGWDIAIYTETASGTENTLARSRGQYTRGLGTVLGLNASLGFLLTEKDTVYVTLVSQYSGGTRTAKRYASGSVTIIKHQGTKGEKGDPGGGGGTSYDDTEVKRDIDTNQTAISTLQTTVSGLSNYNDQAVRDLITGNSDSISDLRTALAGKASVSESNSFPLSPETHDVVVIKTALTGLSGVFDIDYTAITTAAKYDVFQWDGFRWVQLGSLNPVSSGGGGGSYDDSALVQRTDNIERALRVLNFREGEVIVNDNDASAPAGNLYLVPSLTWGFVLDQPTGTDIIKQTSFSNVINKYYNLAPPGELTISLHIQNVENLRSHIGESFIIRNKAGAADNDAVGNLKVLFNELWSASFPTAARSSYVGVLYGVIFDNQSTFDIETISGSGTAKRLLIPEEESVLFTVKEIAPISSINNDRLITFTVSNIPPLQEHVFDNTDAARINTQSIADNAEAIAEGMTITDLNFAPMTLSKASFPSQVVFTLAFRYDDPLTSSHYASLTLQGANTPRVRLGDNPVGLRLTFSTAGTTNIKNNATTNAFDRAFLHFYTASSGGSPVLTRHFQVWIGA